MGVSVSGSGSGSRSGSGCVLKCVLLCVWCEPMVGLSSMGCLLGNQ